MKKNKLLLFLTLLFAQFSFAQLGSREIINGQIISDSTAIDNVTVFNISSNKGAVTDKFGLFTMYARPSDTLVFSSVIFKSKKLVLNENDFKVIVLKIKLEEFINELDEVIVTPSTLTGDLEKDAKNIKVTDKQSAFSSREIADMQMEKDFQSTQFNTAMPSDLSIPYGMDFVKIGKMVGKLFTKDKPKSEPMVFTTNKNFQEAVKDKFTYHFFTETLGLKQEEIGLFLNYCDSDPSVRNLLAVNKEIDLIDFLISKSKKYKELPKD
ncbi:MAG TPA: carboxypeptidase-like regulatory domain-containing protein [Flavobacterium sp.]|uniref:carboxypeptidase-like regulatory domain-containing protein n=1 Tax=unclassified Flavobacterium TaxID=196869 RepID=UPI0025BA6588|nr:MULTISPECIES: carboxypeptidase-like regulatory domain-containing protein [unclassified Flavobacterium]HRE78602.1 carboxypeptidase-like regulatory domain-containing protein [Flavobacterium sp.]